MLVRPAHTVSTPRKPLSGLAKPLVRCQAPQAFCGCPLLTRPKVQHPDKNVFSISQRVWPQATATQALCGNGSFLQLHRVESGGIRRNPVKFDRLRGPSLNASDFMRSAAFSSLMTTWAGDPGLKKGPVPEDVSPGSKNDVVFS